MTSLVLSGETKNNLLDKKNYRRNDRFITSGFLPGWSPDGSDERVLVSDVKVIPMRTSWQPVFFVEPSNKPDSR